MLNWYFDYNVLLFTLIATDVPYHLNKDNDLKTL